MATPSELLDSAKLIEAIDTPTTCADGLDRAVVSRGYYAAYHAALEVKERLALPPPLSPVIGSHEKIFASLLECTPGHCDDFLKVKSIGLIGLRTLKPYRKAADYDICDPMPFGAKEQTLARSAIILEKSQQIKPK